MKIGTVVFSSLMGICGTSAWMGRSLEGSGKATGGTGGLVLQDSGEYPHPLLLSRLINVNQGWIRVKRQLVSTPFFSLRTQLTLAL
jgi:hypothetical protein